MTADVAGLFGDRTIPAGTVGAVMQVHGDGTCFVDCALKPQTADEDGDFLQALVSPGQLEIVDPPAADTSRQAGR